MDAFTILAINAVLDAAIKIWTKLAGKEDGWEPTAEDWARMRRNNRFTADDFEAGPVTLETPPPPVPPV